MYVPVGMTVTLDIGSNDVQHSWWIPELGGKMDALPGYTNKTWFKVTEPGAFRGQCAELCGRNHANMYASVVALPYDEWKAWYDRQATDLKAAEQAAAEGRKRAPGAGVEPRPDGFSWTSRPPHQGAPPADHHRRGAARADRLDVVVHHDRPQEDRDPLPLDRRRRSSCSAASRRC